VLRQAAKKSELKSGVGSVGFSDEVRAGVRTEGAGEVEREDTEGGLGLSEGSRWEGG
jgi:hypothetical protein